MERRINIACFEPGSKVAKVDDIWQWDYGQILRIQGLNLPTAVEIHFSLDEQNGEAVRRIGITQDGVTDVVIPDTMLENESAYCDSYYFFAYIYLTDETSGNTEYKIQAKVTTRSKPEGYNSGDSTFAAILKTVNEIADDKVTRPESAKVGQVLSVKATDEEGKPTEFEATDPGGGVSDEKIAEAVGTYMEAHPIEETDPTVPQWAKQPEKPTYTASEVGADAAGTAESKVSDHNRATDAHNDIRLLVQGLTKRLDALADSDDETLDQMSEVVAYIKSNKSLIDAITTSKVSVSDIIDNLTTNVSNKPLSAAQGVKLKALIDAIPISALDASMAQENQVPTADGNGNWSWKEQQGSESERVTKPQWAEFPRETNPARDIYNRTAMDNALELGTSGTLRHNALVEGDLITWTESTNSSDTASGSSGGVDVKIKHVYDNFGNAYKQADPWGSNYLRYTDDVTVFPSGESIYGADGSVIDTVVATSDSTIINIGSSNYIILAYCSGNSDYHMVYRTASISSHTITLSETINVLTINGSEWDMTTLRSDYTNKLSQLNTKVVKVSNVYYMAVVQSKVGIAIMKSSDGIDWSLHAHVADEDAYLEACLGCVSWVSNYMPKYYLVVRHPYGDGYLTLYGSGSLTFEEIISKVFIPAATGRAIIDSRNNADAYLIYSVNGRKNAVLAKILPNSDGTTGISILETPDNCLSNYPCIYVGRTNTASAFIVGTNGINKNDCSVSVSYIWINNTDIEKEKNEQIKKVMFGASVEVIQTLTEGTEIGSVAGTKLYAPKVSTSSGGGVPTLELLGSITVSEDTGRVDFTFDTALNLKKILVYAHTIGVSDFSSQARGIVYINDKLVADGFENNAFNSGAERYMLFEIDVLSGCTVSKAYSETIMGSGYASEKVAFLMKTDINANTDITKISFLANIFGGVAIASGTTISVYGY